VPRSPKLFNLPDDYIYPDGMSLKQIRDAIVASGKIGMFRVGWDMAKQYNLQEALCMKCACAMHPSQGTYLTRNQQAMRFCSKCVSQMPRNH